MRWAITLEAVALYWHHSREDTVQLASPVHCSRKQPSQEAQDIRGGIYTLRGCVCTCQHLPARTFLASEAQPTAPI